MMYIILLSLLLILTSCSHQHGHNHANRHMHEKSHEILIADFEDPKRDLWQNPSLVLKKMGDLKDKRILDIGVGSGYFSHQFLKVGASVTGADVDDKFLQHVKERFSSFKRFSTHKLEFDDPKLDGLKFDFIFTSNTYHHIDNRVEYLKKLKPALVKDGKLVIVDFKRKAKNPDLGPPPSMRVDYETVIRELELAGYSLHFSSQDELPNQYLIIVKNN